MASADSVPRTKTGAWLVLACVIATHLAAVFYALPPAVIFGPAPYGRPDYQTHYAQSTLLSQSLQRYGRLWSYDPNLLAGQPEGLVFDLDNKGHALFTHALVALGVPRPIAFNLFTLLSSLLAPLSVWLAARLFRVGRGAQNVAILLSVLLWHFDWAPHFAWSGGMISFATVSHGSLLALALFHRLLTEPRAWIAIALGLLLPALVLIHVLAVAILLVPLFGIYLARARRLGVRQHLLVWGLASTTLAASLTWLWPSLTHLDLVVASKQLGQAGASFLWFDFVGIQPADPLSPAYQTPFRLLAFCGAAITLWRWRKDADPRLLTAGMALGWLLGMTYLGSYLPVLGQSEPYRFVFPAMLLASVFAAPWWRESLSPRTWRTFPATARVLAAVLFILVLPRVVRQVMFTVPELEPGGATQPPPGTLRSQSLLAFPPPIPVESRASRVAGPPLDDVLVAVLLRDHTTNEGRVLVQSWALAEYLRWASERPIIGGFPERRLVHQAAHPFRDLDDPRLHGDELAKYLERYNVRYLVMTTPEHAVVESRSDLLEPVQVLFRHRVYRVRKPARYFASGSGQVTAELNRITVKSASPTPGTQSLVLRFHWLDELRCRPGCRLEREAIPHDPAGFIRVVGQPTLPSELVIENSYER